MNKETKTSSKIAIQKCQIAKMKMHISKCIFFHRVFQKEAQVQEKDPNPDAVCCYIVGNEVLVLFLAKCSDICSNNKKPPLYQISNENTWQLCYPFGIDDVIILVCNFPKFRFD